MFILEMGKTLADAPDIAGTTAAWHEHQDLCWDAPNMRIAGRLVNGRCVPGGTFAPTPPIDALPRAPVVPLTGRVGATATGGLEPLAAVTSTSSVRAGFILRVRSLRRPQLPGCQSYGGAESSAG